MDFPRSEKNRTGFQEDDPDLRAKLVQLSKDGKITHTTTFLNNKKKCSVETLRKIMDEYTSREISAQKKKNIDLILSSIPKFAELIGLFHFTCEGGADGFASLVSSDENAMFLLSEILPVGESSEYSMKMAFGIMFLTMLCYDSIGFGRKGSKRVKSVSSTRSERSVRSRRSRRSRSSLSLSSGSEGSGRSLSSSSESHVSNCEVLPPLTETE